MFANDPVPDRMLRRNMNTVQSETLLEALTAQVRHIGEQDMRIQELTEQIARH